MSINRWAGAVLLACLALAALGLSFAPTEVARSGSTALGGTGARQSVARPLERPCRPGADDRASDLCAQWEAVEAARNAAFWTKWGVIVSGLGSLLAFAALFTSIRATRAAIDAVEADITSVRPLMSLRKVTLRPAVPREQWLESGELLINFHLGNIGQSPCWTELGEIQLWSSEEESKGKGYVIRGYENCLCAPSEHLSFADDHRLVVGPEAREAFLLKPQVLFAGHITYRDAGGRRWRTGFAHSVDLGENLDGKSPAFWGRKNAWFDQRI